MALDTGWRPIQDGTAIAVMAEPTARTVRGEEVVVVPLKPPPGRQRWSRTTPVTVFDGVIRVHPGRAAGGLWL
jgi:hypothetical protein